ncbi:hypothetical protein WA026_017988 [Henosepilachna vigintioctopunctata]
MSEIDEHITRVYEIHKRLGKGAYGIVWKAKNRKTKEIVAVKKIFDAFRNQTDAQRTFREIIFLRTFRGHPNIIDLHSIHRAANNRDIYLGFEYMETDLHNIIKKGNILKDIHKKYVMYQMLKAIRYIHSGNVIHRDLKPSNVLLDSSCRCKIADFGLARSITENADGGIGGAGDPTLTDYVATRWYRAPEILIANRRYTKGIDMWSLGCILAEMLAGKPIFPGSSTVNQVEKIMATIPTPSQRDINVVCISGVGSSMIKNASSVHKTPIDTLLGPNLDPNALDLVSQLLIFNPLDRLTAKDALKHEYVAKFHEPSQEITMKSNAVIPFSDDVRLSVDDYRNKLYELMSSPRPKNVKISHLKNGKSPIAPTSSDIQYRLARNTERYLKGHLQKEVNKSYISQSEPKMASVAKTCERNVGNIKSDSRVLSKCNVQFPRELCRMQVSGDNTRAKLKSRSELMNKHFKKVDSTKALYNGFNSYNKNHGIISQSALTELKAAGLR